MTNWVDDDCNSIIREILPPRKICREGDCGLDIFCEPHCIHGQFLYEECPDCEEEKN